MKITKKAILEALHKKLAADYRWAIRALVRIYEMQTDAERNTQQTIEHNGVGFNAFDAEILSSLAEQVKQGRSLSNKQMAIVFKKIPRYKGQIYQITDRQRLEETLFRQ